MSRLPALLRTAATVPFLLAACSGRSESTQSPPPAFQAQTARTGQLADIYTEDAATGRRALHSECVLIGWQLPPGAVYAGRNPATAAARVLVASALETEAFARCLVAMRAGCSEIALDGAVELPAAAAIELDHGSASLDYRAHASADGRDVALRVVARGARGVRITAVGGWPEGEVVLRAGGVEIAALRTTPTPVGAAPVHLLGELDFYLERVDPVAEAMQVTVYKAGIVHEIDAGDVVAFHVGGASAPALVSEIIVDPTDDAGQPAVQHVRAVVPSSPALARLDPRHLPGYPANPRSAAGQAWLIANAPRAELVAPFTGERRSSSGAVYGDDPRYFFEFAPAPLRGSEPNQNLSPFVTVTARFSAPVAPPSVRPFDTFFLGTRDLLDPAAQAQFVAARNMDPAAFSVDKYFTPHLIAARLTRVDAAGTRWRLQPPLGLYLDDAMRQADEGVPFANKQFRYFAHLIGGAGGIQGRSGAQLDLGYSLSVRNHVVVPFSLDTGSSPSGVPLAPDNRVASVVRRFAALDEDEQPSYDRPGEVQQQGAPLTAASFPLEDLFGAVVHRADGRLMGRPPARIRQVVDDLNQPPSPPQSSVLRHCPEPLGFEPQVAAPTARSRFAQPIQNPLNPFGARQQMAWREIDLSLSRFDPNDMNLDVERLYWGMFTGAPVLFDRFERASVFLGHAEKRPEPCVGSFSALPSMHLSGLGTVFADNYARDLDVVGSPAPSPLPHAGFVDQPLLVSGAHLVQQPGQPYSYLELPVMQEPYFVWRDETARVQGGVSGVGSDLDKSFYQSYVVSPFLAGRGRLAADGPAGVTINVGAWNNQNEKSFAAGSPPDTRTDGSIGAIGLPLLVDFWMYPSNTARGLNGGQVSLAVLSSGLPAFRAYSGGGSPAGTPVTVSPASARWQRASGGFTPAGQSTQPADNAVQWIMADFIKRRSVATSGFVDIADPHRMSVPPRDPRLGPYAPAGQPTGGSLTFAWHDFAPDEIVRGTAVAVEFRGAGAVDPQPWRALVDGHGDLPDAINFPLDPFKAGDAHLRKFDDRPLPQGVRNGWTHYYNRNVTDYTADLNDLADPAFTARFAAPTETFGPGDVRYFNWRLLMQADPVAGHAPAIDSFWVAYRIE